MTANSPFLAAYQAAFEAALIVRHPDPGLLELAGKDRLDLLHRMSTADLAQLPPFHTRQTVFTDPLARTIDVVLVLTRDQDLVLLTSPGKEGQFRAWLGKHIFFQDQVLIETPQPGWTLWGAYGPTAFEALASLHCPVPSNELIVTFEGGLAWSVASPLPGFRVLMQPGVDFTAWGQLAGNPAASAAYDVLRVEAGLPEPGREILDDSIPLEVGLTSAVSFSKGCYTGQEIIARMDSRGKLAKRLAGIYLPHSAQPGTTLVQDRRSIGRLTSVVESPRFGWIGLAVVKPDSLSFQGGQVSLPDGELPARLIELPFDLANRSPIATPLADPLE
ncbi:MAG: YgfZ/GcvT domain-containing protein, partial [Anaerolineales bacterium]